jgi:hypothetical protein
MKKLLISLLFSIPALAQDGFRANGSNIVWEKSFPADNANIVALLDRQPNLKVASFMDNVYKGKGDQIKNTCASGSGLMKNDCKFDFIIMVNPDYYVVKVTNLKILEKFGPMQARTVANPCEKYFLNKQGLKSDDKTSTDLGCLDSYLSSVFSMGGTAGEALTSN